MEPGVSKLIMLRFAVVPNGAVYFRTSCKKTLNNAPQSSPYPNRVWSCGEKSTAKAKKQLRYDGPFLMSNTGGESIDLRLHGPHPSCHLSFGSQLMYKGTPQLSEISNISESTPSKRFYSEHILLLIHPPKSSSTSPRHHPS